MKFKDIFNSDYNISFEVFPPKDMAEEKVNNLLFTLDKLKRFNPALVSVTFGAGGALSHNSMNLTKFLKEKTDFCIMPHYTCVNASFNSAKEFFSDLKKMGISNILALRGDMPENMVQTNFDFANAKELVSYIKEQTNFDIAVAGYSDKHPKALSLYDDMCFLQEKINLGASAVFTQLFFNNDKFIKFYEKIKSENPEVTVSAGILPLSSITQIDRMCKLCGVEIPQKLQEKIDKYPNDITKIGIDFAISQINDLKKNEIKNFHFYILNKSEPISEILDNV